MTTLEAVLAKPDTEWTRDDLEVVQRHLDVIPDREMSEADIRLLFRAGDVEERLVLDFNEANRVPCDKCGRVGCSNPTHL